MELRCPLALIMFVCFASVALIVRGSYCGWERPDDTVGMAVVTGSVVAPRAEPAVEVKGVHVHVSREAPLPTVEGSGLTTAKVCVSAAVAVCCFSQLFFVVPGSGT